MTRVLKFGMAASAVMVWNVAAEAAQDKAPRSTNVAITGQIVDGEGSELRVYYGDWLSIDMSGWAWFSDPDPVRPPLEIGEEATFFGYAGKELFAERTFRPQAVFVEDRSAYFTMADNDVSLSWELSFMPKLDPFGTADAAVVLAGAIKSIDGQSFSLDIGPVDVSVSTEEMVDNPFDAIGPAPLETGDLVQASGPVDAAFFNSRQLSADNVTLIVSMRPAESG